MVQSNDITAVCVLAIKGPTGVTLEVNLRNSLHTGEEACKGGIHPGFEFQGRHYQKSKTGIWVTPQKELMSSKSFKKNQICNSNRVAMAQGKQGIWFLLFPDRENTGNFVLTQGKIC